MGADCCGFVAGVANGDVADGGLGWTATVWRQIGLASA